MLKKFYGLAALAVLCGCSADKNPAATECERLSKANVARECRYEAPPLGYATDCQRFNIEGSASQGGILTFKDETDFDRAVGEMRGVTFETDRKRRMILWFTKTANDVERQKVKDAFFK